MKKILLMFMIVTMISLSAVACSENEDTSKTSNEEPTYKELPDSQNIAEQIKASNDNVGEIETFDETTDPNGSLGRPGEYISKADFEDIRLDQYGEYPVGGTIETFENESDCNNRYEYLKTLQDSSLGMLALDQYIYKYDKIIIRLEYDLTPEQAEEYHSQIDTIMAQYQDISTQESDTDESANLDAQEVEEQAVAETEAQTTTENKEQAATEDASQDSINNATTEQLNALASAESYIDLMGFSHSGLITQLEFDGYSTEAATYAADNCGADWNEEAAESAQSYMDVMSFSRQGLIDQLIFDRFTQEQAEYGASSVGY